VSGESQSDPTVPAPGVPAPDAAAPISIARPSADPGDLTGQLLADRYQVAQKIGEGGMCFVYLASDTNTGERVAIKKLLPKFINDRTAMARLRREAALGSKLAHPNVCHIISLGETSAGFDYIVMPYVAGDLLCVRTARAGQLPLDVTAAFVRDMAAGLDVAHEHGIIHRDLKPENIMIAPGPDGSERAVVMDFSLATEESLRPSMQLTADGLVVGTPEFMSPEQLRGDPLDRRSDIYSLAFMVYEMLTGKLPFDGPTQRDIMIARFKGNSIPIRTRRPDLDFPVAVEKVMNKGLAYDPNHRYATALEFGRAFTQAAKPHTGWMARLLRR
jgi:serine/threonine protein kinase